jgi:glycine betaine/choline ABC-type transport system substrate-binding protein
MGDTRAVHQAMLNGEISLYPEYSGLVVTELLKEAAAAEPSVVFERARLEMKRIELVEFMAPFGFNAPVTLVVRGAGNEAISTATQAAASATRWKVGISYEFQNRQSGLPALNTYRLEMGAPLRSMKDEDLFTAMEQNTVSMVTGTLSDPHLLASTWKTLTDDQHAFAPAEAGLLVRDDVLTTEPKLREVLAQLTGKIDLNTMRKLNAQVLIDKKSVPDVAAEFLKSAGLN